MTEEQLAQAHAVLDVKRLAMVNRTVVRLLHDAVYPSNTVESPATIKLRSILKTLEVTQILEGEKLPTESEWAVHPWLMPAVLMYGRLAYKFEGMTDMINGAFMEDLSELLNAATGDQRSRKSFYEIDTEFEKMTASLLKNFSSMASLMPFLRASLRQRMMRRLATVGKDKDGWKKADEHLTILMDQEHMITIEDTDAAIKRCEQYLQRDATDEGSPKVLATEVEISGQDTAAELAALKATAKAQDAKIKALSAQLRDKKKADMAKRQSSSKDSTCHASLHGCVFDQEFVPHTPGTVLDSGAQVNILEGTLGSGTRIQLTGITGATTEAERADAVFPVIARMDRATLSQSAARISSPHARQITSCLSPSCSRQDTR